MLAHLFQPYQHGVGHAGVRSLDLRLRHPLARVPCRFSSQMPAFPPPHCVISIQTFRFTFQYNGLFLVILFNICSNIVKLYYFGSVFVIHLKFTLNQN